MKLYLKIWRQKDASSPGKIVDYTLDGVEGDMSFLEMLDILNEELVSKGEEPVEFDHDCREGICGSCSLQINGEPHGPDRLITTCQLHMRKFNDGDTIVIEPFRAKAFPVIKDLIVDRSAFDRIQQAGGYISVNTSGTLWMPMPSRSENKMRMRPWTQPLALVAVPVLRPVRMPVPCCSLRQRFPSSPCFHRVA